MSHLCLYVSANVPYDSPPTCYTYIHSYKQKNIYTHAYMYVCLCMYVCIHGRMYAFTNLYVSIYVYVFMYEYNIDQETGASNIQGSFVRNESCNESVEGGG